MMQRVLYENAVTIGAAFSSVLLYTLVGDDFPLYKASRVVSWYLNTRYG